MNDYKTGGILMLRHVEFGRHNIFIRFDN